jgi:hypothetical protein
MVRKWMDYSNELLDSQLGAAFKRFIAQEWKYATSMVSRTTSAESVLKAMGVTGGGSSSTGHSQEEARGSRNNNKDDKRGHTGDHGPHQVPVGPTQQGGGSQVTTKAAYSAAGGVTRKKGNNPGEDDHHKRENRVPAQDKKTLRCYLQECQADPHHALGECPKFNAMPILRRWGIVKDRKICEYCLGHTLNYPCWRAASRQTASM